MSTTVGAVLDAAVGGGVGRRIIDRRSGKPQNTEPRPDAAAPGADAERGTLSAAAAAVEAADADRGVVDAVVLASRALVGLAARSLAGLDAEVTLPQFRMLVVLASRGPQGLGDLADALGVSPSTATRMCDRLVRKRLVRRNRPRHDRRQVRIALTGPGTTFVETVFARRRAEASRLLAQMPQPSKLHLVEALTAFAIAAGELNPQGGQPAGPDPAWAALPA